MNNNDSQAVRSARHIKPDSAFFVVRIWWSSFQGRGGYAVIAQSPSLSHGISDLRKAISSGSACLRERSTGKRFSLSEALAHV